jgi:DNA-binding NtrC family response regulator
LPEEDTIPLAYAGEEAPAAAPPDEAEAAENAETVTPPPSLNDPALDERSRILAALERCAGNQTRAARLLGMSRGTLVSRLTEYDLPRPRKRASS